MIMIRNVDEFVSSATKGYGHKHLLLLTVLLLGAATLGAQDIFTLNPQVIPPFDGSFANFHSKVIITVHNTARTTIPYSLEGSITGPRGLTIEFRPNPNPQFALMPNQTTVLTGMSLQPYFTEQNVAVTGITKDELYRGNGLPAGTYQLCFRARHTATGNYLSMQPPVGCFSFTVTQVIPENAVAVRTQVIPPYSTYLEDYVNQNKLLVILQNQSGTAQQLRLIGSIKGNNGVLITIPETFIPSKPIQLTGRQILQLSGNDLREYFSESALVIQGITRDELTDGNGLPEGNYQLCLQAVDYRGGQPRSPGSPSGCSMVDIQQFEPPFTIQPTCNTSVSTIQPQNLLFTWSIPAGVRPDQVEYILKIIELYPQDVDPNQAMLSANVPPLFEKAVRTNTYVYSLSDPKLEPGKRYAYRVTARTNTTSRQARRNGPLNFRNNGHSQVCTFTFGKPNTIVTDQAVPAIVASAGKTIIVNPQDVPDAPAPQQNAPPDATDSPGCIADCTVAAPTNVSEKNIASGDVVQIGKFSMTVTSGNNASGTGTILINFLNTPLNVKWSNLQVNTDNHAFGNGSKVTAVMDIASLSNHDVTNEPTENPALSPEQVSAVHQLAQQASRKVSQFPANNSQAIGLPVAVDYGNIDLVVMGVVFTPTSATLNAISIIQVPQSTEQDDLLMLSSSICVRPNGFGEAGTVKLMQDNSIAMEKIVIVYEGLETSASFDCSGIQEITLAGKIEFDRSAILPVNDDGEVVGNNTNVSADFATTVSDPDAWTLSVNALSHSFTVPSLVGFRMTASQITLDQSDQTTPAGAGHPASWQGVHIGSLQIVLNGIFQKNDNPLTFSVDNFSIGSQGLSGDIDPAGTVLQLNEGKIGSWPISVNNFSIELTNSSITGSNIEGKLKLPIAANELDYSITIMGSQSENEIVDFQFNVQQATDLDVEMWFATIDLEETSTIGIQKVGNSYKPTADLTGNIEIHWNENDGPSQNNSVGNFEMPELDFEHLTIADNGNSAPDINVEMIELANGDGLELKLATFTAHCAPPGFVKNGNKIGLAFDIDLELIKMTNSLNGETAFTIFAEYQNNEFKYKETKLNKISLGGDIGVANMNGEVEIYSKHVTFGNGFRGEIDVVINALGGAGINAVLQVGRVNSFNYWYFDVMANLGVAGFNIPGTMASIYGLGGGAYGNMVRSETPVQTIGELNETAPYSHVPGANKDGLTFTPQQGTFGFSAAVAFGLTGASAAFNGDLKFSMEMQSSGAVNHVILEGGCYMMQNITDRESGLVTGTVYAEIEPRIPNATNAENAAQNRPNFRFIAGMQIDVANGLISGGGTLDLWFCPTEWWIKLGEWENEDVPWEDDSRVNITVDLKIVEAHFHSYFMMGSNIPGMPQMPLMVREEFESDAQPLNPAPRIGLLTTNNPGAVSSNPGLAFGAGSYFGSDMKFLIFYADIDFIKGFDVILKKYTNSSCGPKIGINGWYAQGQAYFYINFDVGVELDIWVWKGKASILAATTAATVQAALPNPIWLKGQFLIKGEVLNGLFSFNTNFRFEIGEKCDLGTASPFDQMPIISDITPQKNEDDVSVYIVPETAFNFPKDEFSYDEEVDGELVTKTYKYVFKTFTLSYKDPKTNENKVIALESFINYRPGGLSATYYYPDMILPEHTTINYTIYVQGWQMEPGAPKKVHDETYTGSFKSGSWPSHIEPEQLVEGNPQFRQNFFLKNESPTGYLLFKNPHPHFTNNSWWYSEVFKLGTYSGMGSGSFTYKARFKELETNEAYETTYSMEHDKKMVFNIPPGLKNNKIYQLEILVKFTPPINSFVFGEPSGNVNQTYENVLINGQQGGGIVGVQNIALQMQHANTGNQGVTLQGSNNLQVNAGNQGSNQQILANNYQALAAVNPALGPVQFASNSPAPPNPNVTFNASMALAGTGPGDGTFIQRRKNELINRKKAEQGLAWPLFDDLKWFFKTSRFNTLQAKLNSMKNAGIVYHEYTGNYERFNIADAVHEPVFGEGTQIPITTKVPVILLEIEETFEIPYEIGGYAVTIANNINETIHVPAKVSLLHSGYEDWMGNEFFHGPDNPYNIPDADDWAKLPYYEDEEAMYLGHYAQMNLLYPGTHWENFMPEPFNNDPWTPDRHSGGNNAKPFGNQDFFTPYQVMSGMHKPMQVFFKNSFTHGNIDFGNKGVTWFKNSLLAGDAIVNAINKGNQADPDDDAGGGGVAFGGAVNFQGNVYGQVNPGIQGADQLLANTKQHLAVIDYTEWVAMRDFYLLQKYVYQMNEEEEGTFFTECTGSDYSNDNTTNCYYPAIKSWINNVWRYTPRPANEYSFKLGNTQTSKVFFYNLNSVLNPGN